MIYEPGLNPYHQLPEELALRVRLLLDDNFIQELDI